MSAVLKATKAKEICFVESGINFCLPDGGDLTFCWFIRKPCHLLWCSIMITLNHYAVITSKTCETSITSSSERLLCSVSTCLDYCNALLTDVTEQNVNYLQCAQNSRARVYLSYWYSSCTGFSLEMINKQKHYNDFKDMVSPSTIAIC